MKLMLRSQLVGRQNIRMSEVEIPTPSPGEVLIKVSYAGICGSDLHRYNCDWELEKPMTLGHEASGVVALTGKNVSNLKEGDMVAIEPVIPCLKCKFCLRGQYNLCSDLKIIPLHMPGAFSEYIVFDSIFSHKLPKEIDLQTAALAEPLAVALHAVEQSDPKPEKTALVLGTGAIGLFTIACLKAYGITDIIATDISQKRLETAKIFGACQTVNVNGIDVKTVLDELTNGFGADIVIEASGNKQSAAATPYYVSRGGVIVQVGVVNCDVPLNYPVLINKEATLKQSYKYVNNFPTALMLLNEYPNIFKKIITHVFPIHRLPEALDFSLNNAAECIKTIISF